MKLRLRLLLPFLTIISISACKQKTTEALNASTTDTTVIPDSVIVPVKEAKVYIDNYSSKAGFVDATPEEIAAGKPKKKPDTRCIWFSKDRLQAMLNQLEKEKGNGIRFYLATYDKKYLEAQTKKSAGHPQKEYWGYNTLVMVSTKPAKNDEGEAINKDYYVDIEKGTPATGRQGGFIVSLTPENRGELCPPPADCFKQGATLLPNH